MRQRFGLNPVQLDRLGAFGLTLAQYQFGGTPSAENAQARLRTAQPRWVVSLNTRNYLLADTRAALSQPLPRLYALGQLGLDGTSSERAPVPIKVGVADTGFDTTSPLRVSRFVVRDLLAPGDVPAPTAHGTAIAQLIAGAPLPNGFRGVAPGVELHWARTVRLIDGQARSNTAIMVRAVNWLAEQGVAALNISQGGPGDEVLRKIFARLVATNVLVVAAAGNSGPTAAPVYPAGYPGVLAVTAVDADEGAYAQANRGSYIALAAPGVDVWVPESGGQYMTGTSFASALVAGALAHAGSDLWRVPNPARLTRLCAGARDLGTPGRDTVFGCGLVRVAYASSSPTAPGTR